MSFFLSEKKNFHFLGALKVTIKFDSFKPQEAGVQPLYLIGRSLRSIGADTFVLGIGKNVSSQELRQVVQNRQNVFLVQTFKSLTSIKPQLSHEIIQRTIGKFLKARNINSD